MTVGSSLWLLAGFVAGFRIRIPAALLLAVLSQVILGAALLATGHSLLDACFWAVVTGVLVQVGYFIAVCLQASSLEQIVAPAQEAQAQQHPAVGKPRLTLLARKG